MDHPRSRGEYRTWSTRSASSSGSSPLSRGIRFCGRRKQRWQRIIPALAGNTSPVSAPIPVLADHPRSRGEYMYMFMGLVLGMGSSPLSRGIPRSARNSANCSGIIPALAGNTRCQRMAVRGS